MIRVQFVGSGGMNNVVHLLWFVQERNEGEEDTELLIGVYSTKVEAEAAIARLRDKPGFANFQEGFQVHAYELGCDHWTEGFVRD